MKVRDDCYASEDLSKRLRKNRSKKAPGKKLVRGTLQIGGKIFDVVFYKRMDGSQALYDIKGGDGKQKTNVLNEFVETLNKCGLDKLKGSFEKRSKYNCMINLLLLFSMVLIIKGIRLFFMYQCNPVMLLFPAGAAFVGFILLETKARVWKQ